MTVHIAFCQNSPVKASHGDPDVIDGKYGDEEYITAGNATTITCPAGTTGGTLMARVFNNSGAPVYVSFGTAPNAATDGVRFLVPNGSVEYFAVVAGDKAAVAALS